MELAVIFAFVSMVFWGFTDFLIQRSVRKIGDIEALAFIVIIGTIAMLPFVAGDFHLLLLPQNAALLLVLGIVAFCTAVINFEALKSGKLSIIDVIFEIELPVVVILGMVFFGETLSLIQFLLAAVVLLGVVLIATKSFKHLRTNLEKGVVLAFIAAILMGVVDLLMTTSSRQVSPLLAVWGSWVVVSALCVVYLWRKRAFRVFGRNFLKLKWLLLAMTAVDLAAWVLYSLAVNTNDMGIITAITESYPAIALFLGVILNKERCRRHQYLGAMIALAACIALGFTL